MSYPPNLPLPTKTELRRLGATMLLIDAAKRLNMSEKIAENFLTILDLPGRKRVATSQVENFEKWIEEQGKQMPWLKKIPHDGAFQITGGDEEFRNS